jgi:hypothetical protein
MVVAERRTWGFELFVLLQQQNGGKALSWCKRTVFDSSCELQVSIWPMSSISATSDPFIRRSSRMIALAYWMWSWVGDVDGRPDRASSDTFSSGYQRFYPSLNFSLTHTINTTLLCYYFSVRINGFYPFCPKESYRSTSFKDGVIGKRSVHVFTDTPSTRTTMELCAMHVQTCENPVKIGYNHSAAITCYSLNSQVSFSFLFTLVFRRWFVSTTAHRKCDL